MSDYPPYIDGKPQQITLAEYDLAPWAGTTCVDFRDQAFYVVVMQEPEKIVVKIDPKDYPTLNKIFTSAHKSHFEQTKETK